MRHVLIFAALLLGYFPGLTQTTLKGSLIESWPKKDVRINYSEDYNRISSYLYILNEDQLLEMFKGVSYSKVERKELGISKNDKPDILQMSIIVRHTSIAKNEPLTIPLFLMDFREKDNTSSFRKFDGKLFSDIASKDITSNIMGEVKVNALISNSSKDFWRSVAIITADIGKSAASLALGNPLGAIELKNKLSEHLDKGLTSLNNLSDGEKNVEHSFFIDLVDLQSDNKFDEIVTSARLYHIHWIKQDVLDTIFLNSISDKPTPNSFYDSVKKYKTHPLVLVIETRTKTKIQDIGPTFTQEYYNKIKDEYERYPRKEWEMFRNYSQNFNTAFQAANYIKSFETTANSTSIDWNSLINAIEYSYRFRISYNLEVDKYSSSNYDKDFKDRFSLINDRYDGVDRALIDLYRKENRNLNLEFADNIILSLLNPSEGKTLEDTYLKIEHLSKYDLLATNLGKPGLISNSSYSKCKSIREGLELTLYNKVAGSPPSEREAKVRFYQNIIDKYPNCYSCVISASNSIQSIKGENLVALKGTFKTLTDEEYKNFNECRKLIEGQIPVIKTNTSSILDELDKAITLKSVSELENGLKVWKEIISKDYENANNDNLNLWKNSLAESKKAISNSIKVLESRKVAASTLLCTLNNP